MTKSLPSAVSLPESFKARIRSIYGQEGIRWLAALPELRESLIKRWSLQAVQPVNQLSYNYLEFARSRKFGAVVLKICVPNPELYTEIKALELYQGQEGVVRLIDRDIDQGALLLERIEPGYKLSSLANDQEATRISARAMMDIILPAPQESDFPTMEKWCQGFVRYQNDYGKDGGPLPPSVFSLANDLVSDLLREQQDRYLLHGDLHHYNLLFREDGAWIAIDPKGVIGEIAFEAGPYLFNPIPDLVHRTNLLETLERRLEIMEEITDIDQHRLAAWSFCRTVLAAIWSIEEGKKNLSYWRDIAGVFQQLLGK